MKETYTSPNKSEVGCGFVLNLQSKNSTFLGVQSLKWVQNHKNWFEYLKPLGQGTLVLFVAAVPQSLLFLMQ